MGIHQEAVMQSGSAAERQVRQAWEKVGERMRRAVLEIAQATGDASLVAQVEQIVVSAGAFPPAEVFSLLEKAQPGATGIVLDRVNEIMAEEHTRELAELSSLKGKLKRLGGALLGR